MAKKKSSSRLDLTSSHSLSQPSSAEVSSSREAGLKVVENEPSVNERNPKSKSPSKLLKTKSKSTLSLGTGRSDTETVPTCSLTSTTIPKPSHGILHSSWIANFFGLKKKKSKLTISDKNQSNPVDNCCNQHQHLCDTNCIPSLSGNRNSRLRDSISPELPEDVIKELKQTLTTNYQNNQEKSITG